MRRHGSSPLEGDSVQDVLPHPRCAQAGNPNAPFGGYPFRSLMFPHRVRELLMASAPLPCLLSNSWAIILRNPYCLTVISEYGKNVREARLLPLLPFTDLLNEFCKYLHSDNTC